MRIDQGEGRGWGRICTLIACHEYGCTWGVKLTCTAGSIYLGNWYSPLDIINCCSLTFLSKNIFSSTYSYAIIITLENIMVQRLHLRTFLPPSSLGSKHLQHRVYSFQLHFTQACQHAHNICPENLFSQHEHFFFEVSNVHAWKSFFLWSSTEAIADSSSSSISPNSNTRIISVLSGLIL